MLSLYVRCGDQSDEFDSDSDDVIESIELDSIMAEDDALDDVDDLHKAVLV